MFRYKEVFVTNEKGKVLEVSGNIDSENRNIGVQKKNGGFN